MRECKQIAMQAIAANKAVRGGGTSRLVPSGVIAAPSSMKVRSTAMKVMPFLFTLCGFNAEQSLLLAAVAQSGWCCGLTDLRFIRWNMSWLISTPPFVTSIMKASRHYPRRSASASIWTRSPGR